LSSKTVRTLLTNFWTANLNVAEPRLVDITGDFRELQDLLDANGITNDHPWAALQFIPSDESPITVSANNSQGLYRERGSLFIHIVEPVKDNAASLTLDRSEVIRDAYRGQRISGLVVESLTPVNFESEATLEFSGGWTSGSIIVNFYYDKIL